MSVASENRAGRDAGYLCEPRVYGCEMTSRLSSASLVRELGRLSWVIHRVDQRRLIWSGGTDTRLNASRLPHGQVELGHTCKLVKRAHSDNASASSRSERFVREPRFNDPKLLCDPLPTDEHWALRVHIRAEGD